MGSSFNGLSENPLNVADDVIHGYERSHEPIGNCVKITAHPSGGDVW